MQGTFCNDHTYQCFLTDIKAAIDAYPPGRKGVDEGGFQIASPRLRRKVISQLSGAGWRAILEET